MSHQICFEKARLGLIPLLEGTDGDLLFEQGSGFRGREATPAGFAFGAQQAIGSGGAHREQLAPNLLGELRMPMLL